MRYSVIVKYVRTHDQARGVDVVKAMRVSKSYNRRKPTVWTRTFPSMEELFGNHTSWVAAEINKGRHRGNVR